MSPATLIPVLLVITFSLVVYGAVARLRELRARLLAAEEKAQASARSATEAGRRKVAEVEQRLERAHSELQLAHGELASLSYSISHDLRAPLRGIDGFSQALLEDFGSSLDGAASDYLGRVRANAQRMTALIDDLLALSRTARAEIRPEWVDLSAMALNIAESMARAEPARRVKWDIEPDIRARADRRLLECALRHLLENAWKFTRGRSTARIGFHLRPGAGSHEPVYEVSDDGAGFDMRYAGRLFAPFQRMHSPEEFPGTGIGLATVQRIVRRHGGSVWADASVGQGAKFSFTLPETAWVDAREPAPPLPASLATAPALQSLASITSA